MSLYIRRLRKLRERLLDRRRLRNHERKTLDDYLEAADWVEVNRLELIYEYEFCDRADADGLEDPPKSLALNNWGGDVMSAQREFLFYTDKANERKEALKRVDDDLAQLRKQLEQSKLGLVALTKLQGEISIKERDRSVLVDPTCGPSSIDWAERMAHSWLSGLQWKYEKHFTEDDKRYIEPPRFPITCLEDIPQTVDHVSYVFYPDEPSPFRRAVIEVIDGIISRA